MKRLILIIAVLILMVPALCQAADPVCSPGNTINLTMVPEPLRLTTIRNEVKNFASHPEGDHYEVCFQMQELLVSSIGMIEPIYLKVGNPVTKDVYIVGIKLKVDGVNPVNHELFVVKNDSPGRMILKDFEFKDVKKGIMLDGKASEIRSSIIEGDGSGADACVDVAAAGSVLDDVEISKCKEGVLVQANGVVITKSTIQQNKLGVLIKTGIEGTDIISSKIYANDDGSSQTPLRDDGVRIEGGVAHATAFYDIVDGEAVPISEGEDVVDYGERTPYILVPLPPGETKPAKMEFYLSDREDCGLPVTIVSKSQACGIVEVEGSPMRIDIDAAALEQGPVAVQLPPAEKVKEIVTIYSDPELGTAGISRRFKVGDTSDGIVTFVSTPYDIPTTGGATETEIATGADTADDYEVDDSGGAEMAGETEVVGGGGIEGTGSSIATAGGCGGGASLTRDSFLNLHVGLNLWWILLIVGLGIGANLVRVRVKKKK